MSDTSQLKVTIPTPLYDYLNSKASKFGLTLSSYVKNLILNDVKDMEYPVYRASQQTENSYKQALQEKNQAVEVKDVDSVLNNL